jgi:hypothetical protein
MTLEERRAAALDALRTRHQRQAYVPLPGARDDHDDDVPWATVFFTAPDDELDIYGRPAYDED